MNRPSPIALISLLMLYACTDNTISAPPPPPPSNVSVAYCAGLEPMWVAFQNGDGAWTRALPTTSNGNVVFQATIASTRGGIATVFQGGLGLTSLQVLFGAPEELESVGFTNPRFCSPAALKTLHGRVAGLDTNEFAIIRGGFEAEAIAHSATGGEFLLQVRRTSSRREW